jgi:AbiJ N-terminal domain 4
MITDIFARRYDKVLTFDLDMAQNVIGPILIQVGQIFFDEVQPVLGFLDSFFQKLNQKLARELALSALSDYPDSPQQQICSSFMTAPYRGFDERQRNPDYYCKTRLSMLELLFREAEAHVQTNVLGLIAALSRKNAANVAVKKKLDQAIQELNVRLQQNGTGLVYSNGFLHLADDQLTAQRIAQPFWEIVADPKWKTVEDEIKEAFDRLDQGQQDALAYATKALESTIKIISGDHGWTTGKERGAANFIDNLSSNGFIAAWEAEAIKLIFSKLRNPHSHGGGHAPPAPLSRAQQTWAIESCMSWIKSLVRRM